MSETHYIYALTDPDTGEIRYVGRTRNPARRLSRHIQPMFNSRSVRQWIREMGRAPQMTIIEQCSGDVVVEREAYWIASYESNGARLLNKGKATFGRVS